MKKYRFLIPVGSSVPTRGLLYLCRFRNWTQESSKIKFRVTIMLHKIDCHNFASHGSHWQNHIIAGLFSRKFFSIDVISLIFLGRIIHRRVA